VTVSKALLGIGLVILAVIASHPVAGALRKAGLPINP